MCSKIVITLIVVTLTSSFAFAAKPAQYRAPRTEFGQPDLQGTWNYASMVPLERPMKFAEQEFLSSEDQARASTEFHRQIEQFFGGPFGLGKEWLEADVAPNPRSSLIVYPRDGRAPKLVPGVQRIGGMLAAMYDVKGVRPVRFLIGGIGKDGPEDRGLAERCVSMTSVPITPFPLASYLQLVQSKDHVIISFEANHEARVIPIDSRPFLDERIRHWTGDSRGRWHGDELIVVTKNFNGLTQSLSDAGTSYDKIVTEKFTRTSDTTIQYEAVVDDPRTFQDKVVLTFPMQRSDVKVYEDACHEGNYSLPSILAGARRQEQDSERGIEGR